MIIPVFTIVVTARDLSFLTLSRNLVLSVIHGKQRKRKQVV